MHDPRIIFRSGIILERKYINTSLLLKVKLLIVHKKKKDIPHCSGRRAMSVLIVDLFLFVPVPVEPSLVSAGASCCDEGDC